jgi:RNA polymerase sigma-70 factor, ECF subfamily
LSADNKFVRSLIENAKQGNNAAIEQLFQMNLGKIYAVALRLTANKSIADTITRETFIEAWKKIHLVRSDASFLKWLIAITVYQTLEVIRNKKPKVTINHNELWELESKDELDKYILALPDQERMIFVLNKIEGYSIEEISDMMGVRKDQVSTHLLIAQTKLIESFPSLKSDEVMKEKISKVIPELQPSVEVRNGIFSYIMDEKLREQKEQEKLAAEIAEKEKQDKPEAILTDYKEETVSETKKLKRDFQINFNLLKKIGYALLVVTIIFFLYSYLSSLGGWDIISMSGQPRQNNNAIDKADGFKSKSTIETNESSSLSVMMTELGRLLIEPSTTISRTNKDNELKLDIGKIKKFEGDATDVLTVITPLAKFKELYKGGAFKLNVNEEGNCKLIVESGWMVITVKEFDSYVPKGFECKVARGRYAIPYPSDSSPQMIALLENFSGFNDPALSTILSLVTKKEALSLWHVIQLISPESRSVAFDKLDELVNVPSGVTKAGILALNKTMLLDWRQEIELKMD